MDTKKKILTKIFGKRDVNKIPENLLQKLDNYCQSSSKELTELSIRYKTTHKSMEKLRKDNEKLQKQYDKVLSILQDTKKKNDVDEQMELQHQQDESTPESQNCPTEVDTSNNEITQESQTFCCPIEIDFEIDQILKNWDSESVSINPLQSDIEMLEEQLRLAVSEKNDAISRCTELSSQLANEKLKISELTKLHQTELNEKDKIISKLKGELELDDLLTFKKTDNILGNVLPGIGVNDSVTDGTSLQTTPICEEDDHPKEIELRKEVKDLKGLMRMRNTIILNEIADKNKISKQNNMLQTNINQLRQVSSELHERDNENYESVKAMQNILETVDKMLTAEKYNQEDMSVPTTKQFVSNPFQINDTSTAAVNAMCLQNGLTSPVPSTSALTSVHGIGTIETTIQEQLQASENLSVTVATSSSQNIFVPNHCQTPNSEVAHKRPRDVEENMSRNSDGLSENPRDKRTRADERNSDELSESPHDKGTRAGEETFQDIDESGEENQEQPQHPTIDLTDESTTQSPRIISSFLSGIRGKNKIESFNQQSSGNSLNNNNNNIKRNSNYYSRRSHERSCTCVRITNVKNNTTYYEIQKFFCGLRIPHNGIKSMRDKYGNRTNEMVVHFDQPNVARNALKFNDKMLKGQIVKVMLLDDCDYYKENELDAYEGCVVSVHNVPFQVGSHDIANFFSEYYLGPDDIMRCFDEDDNLTDEVKVRFLTPMDASQAVARHQNDRILNKIIHLRLIKSN